MDGYPDPPFIGSEPGGSSPRPSDSPYPGSPGVGDPWLPTSRRSLNRVTSRQAPLKRATPPADSSVRMTPQPFSIDTLLERAAHEDASDLHITAGSAPLLRMRGRLAPLEDFDVFSPEETRDLLYRVLSTEQQKRLEIDRQIDFSYSVPGIARFRVNVYFQRDSLAAAFRLVPQVIKSAESLGLPEVLLQLAREPRGLVLVTGPTGSGKSTTLATMIDSINVKPLSSRVLMRCLRECMQFSFMDGYPDPASIGSTACGLSPRPSDSPRRSLPHGGG